MASVTGKQCLKFSKFGYIDCSKLGSFVNCRISFVLSIFDTRLLACPLPPAPKFVNCSICFLTPPSQQSTFNTGIVLCPKVNQVLLTSIRNAPM